MSKNSKPNQGPSNNRAVPKTISRSVSNSRDLVTKAYNNQIITKNADGEYAPIGIIPNAL